MDVVEQVLENFDFVKTQRAMVAVDWQWGMRERAHVPSVEELIECARDLLTRIHERGEGILRTGGFSAGFFCDHEEADKPSLGLGLVFVLERSDFLATELAERS